METAYISRAQHCDFCASIGKLEVAQYDAKFAGGIWAFSCENCYLEAGSPALGMGLGQRLIIQNGAN
jgi:hypothetical protein